VNPADDDTDLRLTRINGSYVAEWASGSLADAQ